MFDAQSKRDPCRERGSRRSPNQKSSGMGGQEDLHSIHQEQNKTELLCLLLKAEGREKDLDCILVPFIVGCFLLKSL